MGYTIENGKDKIISHLHMEIIGKTFDPWTKDDDKTIQIYDTRAKTMTKLYNVN